jgi:3-oxoacyl-[acyl-carrier protein] reductase
MDTKMIILITGTRKGIGKQLAEYYAASGILLSAAAAKRKSFSFENYTHHSLDITDEKAVKKMFSEIRKETWKVRCA